MVNLSGANLTTSNTPQTTQPPLEPVAQSQLFPLDCSRNVVAALAAAAAPAVDSSSPSSTISSLSSLSAASTSLTNLNGHPPPSSREPQPSSSSSRSQHHHGHHHGHHHSSQLHHRNMSSRNPNMNQGGGGGHHSGSLPPGSQNPSSSSNRLSGGQQPPYSHHPSGGQPFNPHHNHHHHGGGGGGGGAGHYYQGNNNNNQPGGINHPRSNPSSNPAGHQGRSGSAHHNNNHHHPNYNPNHHNNNNHHQQQQPRSHAPPPAASSASTTAAAPPTATATAPGAAESNIETIDFHMLETIEYPFCTDHGKYEHIAKIGQGTFGEVYKAKCKKTQEVVALKKVLTENEKEGFPITALREIKILQVLRHENIVRLIEICTTKATAANKYKSHFFLVFEFCEHDLAGLLSNPNIKFSLGEQKKIMHQLLNGLYYIHKNYILHRDMKTANILVTKEGKLKLADFGLARAIEQKSENQNVKYTNRVVTLWYRPPELLLGERCYTRAIDMWGAGCIMAELWTKEPILKGNSEQTQLDLIQALCGSIDASVWPEVDKLELFNKMQLKADLKRKVKERLGAWIKDQCALNLLDRLLTLDPKKRIDSDEALDDDFFWSDPMPTDLKLDKISTSNFELFTAQNNRGRQMHRPAPKPANEQHYDRVY